MSELRNIKWGKFIGSLLERDSLEALFKSRSLQWWFTKGFRKNGFILIDDLDGLVLEYKGVKFYPDLLNYPRMFEAWNRYRIDLIREDDIVLDIGANIGSFTLPAAQRCKRVVAVEPMFHAQLEKNIQLNELNNVEVMPQALWSEYCELAVDCQEYEGVYKAVPFKDFLDTYGSPDVLRLDCGGAEWDINPNLLNDVRQLEIEFHFWEGQRDKWGMWKRWLGDEGYGYTARWSKHKHWLYLSACKGIEGLGEVQLRDGSFIGGSLKLWKSQVTT